MNPITTSMPVKPATRLLEPHRYRKVLLTLPLAAFLISATAPYAKGVPAHGTEIAGPGTHAVSHDRDTPGRRTLTRIQDPADPTAHSRTLFYSDADGNLTSITGPTGSVTLEWDEQGRLIRVTRVPPGGNGETTEYAYLPFSRLRYAMTRPGGAVSQFLWNPLTRNLIQEIVPSVGRIVTFVTGPALDELLARIEATVGTSTLYTYVKDHAGTVLGLIDPDGTLVNAYESFAYGQVASESETVPQDHRFHSSGLDPPADQAFRLQYFRGRYYSPELMRFISRDPLGPLVSANPYTFADGAPHQMTDRDGNFAFTLAAVAAFLTSGTAGSIAAWAAGSGAVAAGVSVASSYATGDGPTFWGTTKAFVVGGVTGAITGPMGAAGAAATGWARLALFLRSASVGAGVGSAGDIAFADSWECLGLYDLIDIAKQNAASELLGAGLGGVTSTLGRHFGRALSSISSKVQSVLGRQINAIRDIATDAKIGYRGSLARGTKGPHKGNAPFDPSDFDVDAFIVSDTLASQFPPDKWFRSGDQIPDLGEIQEALRHALRDQLPGMRDEFTFRIYTTAEYLSKVASDAHAILE